jgi:hypothetical protein
MWSWCTYLISSLFSSEDEIHRKRDKYDPVNKKCLTPASVFIKVLHFLPRLVWKCPNFGLESSLSALQVGFYFVFIFYAINELILCPVQLLVLDIYACPCHTAALPSSTTFAHCIEHHLQKKVVHNLWTLSSPQGGTSASSPLLTLLSISVPSAPFPAPFHWSQGDRRPAPAAAAACRSSVVASPIPSTSLQLQRRGGI